MTSKRNDSENTVFLICHNEGFDSKKLIVHVVELAPGLITVSGQPVLEEFQTEETTSSRIQALESIVVETKVVSKPDTFKEAESLQIPRGVEL